MISTRLVSSDQVADSTAALAQAYAALSTIELHYGDIQYAMMAQRKSLDLLSSPTPTTFNCAMAAAQAHYGMAILYERTNNAQQATDEYDSAVGALELAQEIQDGRVPLEFLAYQSQIVFHQCSLLHKEGRNAEAAEVMRAQVVREKKGLAESHNPLSSLESYRRSVEFLQAIYVKEGDPARAIELCQEWIQMTNNLVADHQQSVQVRYFATMALHIAGHLEGQFGQTEKATRNYREALDHFDQVESEAIRQSSFMVQKVELEIHLCLLNCKTESIEQTETFLQRAVDAAKVLKGLTQGSENDLGPVKDQSKRAIEEIRMIDNASANHWEAALKSEQLW